jgi:hypothetical protein
VHRSSTGHLTLKTAIDGGNIESNTGEYKIGKFPTTEGEILPKGVGDFPIFYFFRCLILFLTKHLIVCLGCIECFPANLFSIAEVNIRFIHMHPCLGSKSLTSRIVFIN